MPVAVVFPPQGTQTEGMGLPWRDDPAWGVVERAEAALGEPLAPLLLTATDDELRRTRASQLGVLAVSLMAWEAVRPLVPEPVAFAGNSFGQVTALIAAGVLSFDDGVRFVARRAEATQAATDARPGRMVALLGRLDPAVDVVDGHSSWLANVQGDEVVIGGTVEGIEEACGRARAAGARRVSALAVGGAFHTPLLDGARPALAEALANVTLHAPSAPVVSNHDARAYDDGEGWRTRLVDHVTTTVLWADSMRALASMGADAFVAPGPGAMSAASARRTVPGVTVHAVATPDHVGRLASSMGTPSAAPAAGRSSP